MSDKDLSNHRPNVGVVLFHPDGRVWLGRRRGVRQYGWQFPQGGVDEGEDHQAAALRELYEETGVRSVTLLGRTDGWIWYDFPPEVLAQPNTRNFAGQKQVWFAFRFDGEESEIDLYAVPPQEFDRWRWGTLDEAVDGVVAFKRNAYRQVADAFRRFERGGG